MTASRKLAVLALGLAVSASCSSSSGPGTVAPVAAQLSVERFLQAANQRDVEAMGRLFGTVDGPALDTGSTFSCFFKKIGSWFGGSACQDQAEIELRMDAIASIVRHEDYRVAGEEPVAGRGGVARRVLVDVTIQGRQVAAAPFIVVRTSEGRWLVEQVPLEQLMGR